jgi:hypothetical protein
VNRSLPCSILSLAVLVPLTACSVGMAMSGKDSPNLGAVRSGITRGEVEMHLGHPAQTTTQPDGSVISTYNYQVGNDPSAGRAIGHATMDLLTLGLWEVVGTPIEGSRARHTAPPLLTDRIALCAT